MSDLFHEGVPTEFLSAVADTMREAHWHVFQVLTKRSERLTLVNDGVDWPANAWARSERRERGLHSPH